MNTKQHKIIPVDIGNSRIKILNYTVDNEVEIVSFETIEDIDISSFSNGDFVISSVNTKSEDAFVSLLKDSGRNYTVLDYKTLADLDLGFQIDFKNFNTIGIDRVLDSVEGVGIVKKLIAVNGENVSNNSSTLVIDMGTANTYNSIDVHGVFRGGVITPGLKTRLASLQTNTSDLPKSEIIDRPFGVEHARTEKAINSGVYFGQLGELKELIDMYNASNVVFTGGCSKYFYDFIQLNGYLVAENLIVHAIERLFKQKVD